MSDWRERDLHTQSRKKTKRFSISLSVLLCIREGLNNRLNISPIQTKESNMAYKRSITSSHESDNSPANSDSSVSWPSGCSKKYEWIWDSKRGAQRLPVSPMPSPPSSSSESRSGESDFDIDEAYNYMDHADSEVPEGGESIVGRMARNAEMQRLRIEQLEQALEEKTAQEQSAQSLTELLAERVASLACFNIQCSLALVRARALVKKLSLALGMNLLLVWLYLHFN